MIQINGLQKVVGTQTLLDIEELNVSGGEVCAVTGPAGSGKSLLMDLMIGRSRPTLGEIQIGTISSPTNDSLSYKVGILFEENGLFPRQTALENLRFHSRLFNLPETRAREVIAEVGLLEHETTRAEDLSSGFARRLAFGRALLHKPEILFLMEPFAHCDESSINLIKRLIKEQSSQGAAIMILASDKTHLTRICDRIFRLNQGHLEKVEQDRDGKLKYPFKIPVRLDGKVLLLNPFDILFIDADDGKTQIWTSNGCLPSHFTLSELEQRLARSGFFRAHRSYLVNLQHVKEVIPYTRNSFSLKLNDSEETKIPLSKSAAAELRDLLDY